MPTSLNPASLLAAAGLDTGPETPEEILAYMSALLEAASTEPPTNPTDWGTLESSINIVRLDVLGSLGSDHKEIAGELAEIADQLDEIRRAALDDPRLVRAAIAELIAGSRGLDLSGVDVDDPFAGSELLVVVLNSAGPDAERIVTLNRALAGAGRHEPAGFAGPHSREFGAEENLHLVVADLPPWLAEAAAGAYDATIAVPAPPAGTDREVYAKLVLDLADTWPADQDAAYQAAAILAAN